ncbi:hypothetical protein PP707_05710 [Acetobacter pasteurianus]|nr:hypothetical protein [Acetobacter pasteurianus]
MGNLKVGEREGGRERKSIFFTNEQCEKFSNYVFSPHGKITWNVNVGNTEKKKKNKKKRKRGADVDGGNESKVGWGGVEGKVKQTLFH